MSAPIVFLLDVLPADAVVDEATLEASITSGGDGSDVLSVFDLGPARGDGIFETIGVVGRRAQSVEAHLARLTESAAILDLPAPNHAQWRSAVARAVAALPDAEQSAVRLVLTRGSGERPTAWVSATPAGGFPERETGIDVVLLDRGLSSDVQERSPWLLAGAKTLSYAVNMAALREAHRRGADDVLFVSSDGFVLEGPTSTVVARIGGTFVTPPATSGILPGTTQLALWEHLEAEGHPCEDRMLTPDDLMQADAVWLLSSVRLAVPVTAVDGRPVGIDRGLTAELNAALLARTE
ncbi:aminodeoxychorismate lyase [Plantibacter sp. LMC-P-059a]|uniref:aminodeoxychorismate lyase n=1 Tax=Plantibacter sp. LMC-P-059a TaxID=3040297 RepID=UPI0025511D19|nr:aminodeoxychorismate lyase [Plantibacter sp. LMC-P-059a]